MRAAVASTSQTPQDLISDGMYKALALAFYPGKFMPVSVTLVARALGAEEPLRGCSPRRLATSRLSWL